MNIEELTKTIGKEKFSKIMFKHTNDSEKYRGVIYEIDEHEETVVLIARDPKKKGKIIFVCAFIYEDFNVEKKDDYLDIVYRASYGGINSYTKEELNDMAKNPWYSWDEALKSRGI